jgi:hypothetical protein
VRSFTTSILCTANSQSGTLALPLPSTTPTSPKVIAVTKPDSAVRQLSICSSPSRPRRPQVPTAALGPESILLRGGDFSNQYQPRTLRCAPQTGHTISITVQLLGSSFEIGLLFDQEPYPLLGSLRDRRDHPRSPAFDTQGHRCLPTATAKTSGPISKLRPRMRDPNTSHGYPTT